MASGLALSLVTAAAAFVTAPFLLDWLGTERYGAFRAALDWFGYVGLLEFGIGGALQALFARSLGSDDRAGVVAVARAGARAYLLAAAAMIVTAVGLSALLPELIRLPRELTPELWAGCGLYLVVYACLPLAPFRSLAEASQRGYQVNLWLIAQAVVTAAAALVLARDGWGLTGQFAAVVAGIVIFSLGIAGLGLRRYPELMGGGERRAGVGRALWALSWPTLLFNLSGRIGLLTDNIVVAGVLGPAAVTSFFLTQRVIALVGAQVQAVGTATWAGLMDLHYRGEHAVFDRRMRQLTRLTAVLGAGLLVPVAVFNRDLITLWVGTSQYAGPMVTWLGAVNAWALAVLSVWGWPLTAAGLVRAVLPAILCSTAVNLAVSIAATIAVGLPGPLIGTAAAFLGVSWWWTLRLLRRHFGLAPRSLLGPALAPLGLALPDGAGLLALVELVPAYDPAWPRWAGLGAIAAWLAVAASGYFLLAWFTVVPTADRNEWAGRLRDWLRRPA
jgi:O-antigen/teichoic acid export membrane protein